jgi:hypothetical protein
MKAILRRIFLGRKPDPMLRMYLVDFNSRNPFRLRQQDYR